jgi:hypothetical protein
MSMMKSNSSQLSISQSNQIAPNAPFQMKLRRFLSMVIGKVFVLAKKFKRMLWISSTG